MAILETKNIFLDENKIIGGIKTDNGIDRVVPIHPAIEPKVGNSARKRASEVEKRKKAQAQAAAAKKLDKMTLKETEETKRKE